MAEAEAYKKAQRIVEAHGFGPVDNPLEVIAKLAGEFLAVKDALVSIVAELKDDEWRYRGQGAEQLRAEIAMYERAMDRAGTFMLNYAKLNIDERLARVSEEQGRVVLAVMTRVAARMNIDLEDESIRALVLEEFNREIEAS